MPLIQVYGNIVLWSKTWDFFLPVVLITSYSPRSVWCKRDRHVLWGTSGFPAFHDEEQQTGDEVDRYLYTWGL